MAELRIPIIGEFRGKKAFDQAGKATSTLDKSVKRLGKTLLGVFGAQQMMRYAKNGVAAFAENEKSARRLETVVKNLGLAFETPAIEASLDRMSAKFGLEGEVLREAFQKLITSTGSALRAQELLNASLDISAGSGVDFLTVNQDLAAAYVGQTRGLRKYNLGLTQSELKTLKFDDALAKLTASFGGAAKAELETYSGQMRVLQEASDNAQEIIGGGLVDSLMILSGDTTVEDLAKSMTELAESTAVALTQLSSFGKGVKDIFGGIATVVEKFILATDPFMDLIIEGDPSGFMNRPRPRARRFFEGGQDSVLEAKRNKERAKAEAASLKRAKELAALQKKTVANTKTQNALIKASQTLDLERISIAAALKGKISETDRLSLSLQLALLNQNDEAATRLSGLLTEAVKRQNELNKMLLATPKAPNPYSEWVIPTFPGTAGAGNNLTTAGGALSLEDLRGRSGALVVPPTEMPSTVPNPYTTAGGALSLEDVRGRSGSLTTLPPITFVVELNGKVVGDAIRDSTLNESLSGSLSSINRGNRFVRPDEG